MHNTAANPQTISMGKLCRSAFKSTSTKQNAAATHGHRNKSVTRNHDLLKKAKTL